jgi:hypothetical protein
MRKRLLRYLAGFVIAAMGAGLVGGQLAAQAPAAARAKTAYSPPRTPDGRPDLTGFYNVATITPVERPSGYGNRLVMTDEEAAAIERYEVERNEKDLQPVDGNRQAPPVGGDRTPTKSYLEGLFRAGGGTVGGYNLIWLNPGDRVLTVDGQRRTSLIVDPVDGRVPTMKPEARERNAAFQRSRVSPDAGEGASGGPSSQYDGPEARPLAERCLLGFGSTSGPPTLPNYFYNNLKQIVQTHDTIMILNEMVHDARIIRIGGSHPPSYIKKWMGDSIGRWEGDTLVVETTNFTNKTQFRGSGENLKVIERFTRTDDNTILYRFTVEDPTTWDRPWTGEYTWLTTIEPLYEYACHEGNYALEGVLRGARLLDREAAAQKK